VRTGILTNCFGQNVYISNGFEKSWFKAISSSLCVTSAFGPKRDEVTGEWRKLHNEELRQV
jgi:hypothetical protein